MAEGLLIGMGMTQGQMHQKPTPSVDDNSWKMEPWLSLQDFSGSSPSKSPLLSSPAYITLGKARPCESQKFQGLPESCELLTSLSLQSSLLEFFESQGISFQIRTF